MKQIIYQKNAPCHIDVADAYIDGTYDITCGDHDRSDQIAPVDFSAPQFISAVSDRKYGKYGEDQNKKNEHNDIDQTFQQFFFSRFIMSKKLIISYHKKAPGEILRSLDITRFMCFCV